MLVFETVIKMGLVHVEIVCIIDSSVSHDQFLKGVSL